MVSKVIAVHKWKTEDTKVVTRKVIEALSALPPGVTLVGSYLVEGGAYCIWEGSSAHLAADVKAYMDKNVPEMATETKPATQFYPPSADIFSFIHTLVS